MTPYAPSSLCLNVNPKSEAICLRWKGHSGPHFSGAKATDNGEYWDDPPTTTPIEITLEDLRFKIQKMKPEPPTPSVPEGYKLVPVGPANPTQQSTLTNQELAEAAESTKTVSKPDSPFMMDDSIADANKPSAFIAIPKSSSADKLSAAYDAVKSLEAKFEIFRLAFDATPHSTAAPNSKPTVFGGQAESITDMAVKLEAAMDELIAVQ